MRFFPIKVAVICLFVTPLLYIATLTLCEKQLQHYYTGRIQNILVGDTQAVLDGSIPLEEQIAKNLQSFLKSDNLIDLLRIDLDIEVTSRSGKIIYPLFVSIDAFSKGLESEFNPQTIAKQNYALLNDGLAVNVKILLGLGSITSLLILCTYSIISLLVFFGFYKKASLKASIDREEKRKIIHELKDKEKSQQIYLEKLEHEKQDLFNDIETLNSKYQRNKSKAKENEEDLFDEIISLENKLNTFIDLKQKKDTEIEELKSQIKKYERRKGSKNKRVDYDFISKRFSALYKNIVMHRKALSGFLNLNDDQQIKAEEIIFMLDRSPDKVTIKRKVFVGKKHKGASLEVLFAYNGRLYFNKDENQKIQVWVIGTKNTQQKDMEFLHSL